MRCKIHLSLSFVLVFLLAGCAPAPEEFSEAAPTPAAETAPVPGPSRTEPGEDHDYATEETTTPPDRPSLPPVTPEVQVQTEPDWPARFEELVAKHLLDFRGPRVGDTVQVTMEHTRRTLEGMVVELGPDELKLRIDQGLVTVFAEQVDDESRLRVFGQAYAEHHARIQALQEYNAWLAARTPPPRRVSPQMAAQPTPAPSRVTAPPSDEVAAVDPPPPRLPAAPEPPRNHDPDGRVPSVLAYIRRNAARPESLRIDGWYPVQQVGNGYQVRVRYELEGAANFGLTREDMVFFMYADGTVYRRAPYRGR